MKKIIAVLILLMLMAGVRTKVAEAGWTDIWCVGGASTQICINSSGHIVPITAGSQNLGTVSYPFGILNLQTLTVTTGITAPTATISGALYLGALPTRTTSYANGNLSVHGALAAPTLNTGQGAYELFAMNQDVESTDNVTFVTVNGFTLTDLSASTVANKSLIDTNALAIQATAQALTAHEALTAASAHGGNQVVNTNSSVQFADVTVGTNIIATAGYIQLYSRSKAEILALTPTVVGQSYYCNDCSQAVHCTSTGTVVTQFADSGNRTLPCD